MQGDRLVVAVAAHGCALDAWNVHRASLRPPRGGSCTSVRDHAEAVDRGQLLALLVGARPVVHRHLEDPLALLDEARGDLGLDREARPR